MKPWIFVLDRLPEDEPGPDRKEKFLCYSCGYDFLFLCWFDEGFGCEEIEDKLDDIIFYRPVIQTDRIRKVFPEERREFARALCDFIRGS
ncbi:MAG: hypothetical protein GY696_16025 [Gammaproteobacteria bacterium]|nr:hypothetical protein [Gammaproteobacteria bacterium]